jgi:hypothetical protein
MTSRAVGVCTRRVYDEGSGEGNAGSIVGFASVADRSDVNHTLAIVDLVEYPPVADADPPAVLPSSFLHPDGRGLMVSDRIFRRTRSMTPPVSASNSFVAERLMVSLYSAKEFALLHKALFYCLE